MLFRCSEIVLLHSLMTSIPSVFAAAYLEWFLRFWHSSAVLHALHALLLPPFCAINIKLSSCFLKLRAFVRFFCFARSYTFTLKNWVRCISLFRVLHALRHPLLYSSYYIYICFRKTALKNVNWLWYAVNSIWSRKLTLIKVFVNSFGHSKAAVCGLWTSSCSSPQCNQIQEIYVHQACLYCVNAYQDTLRFIRSCETSHRGLLGLSTSFVSFKLSLFSVEMNGKSVGSACTPL